MKNLLLKIFKNEDYWINKVREINRLNLWTIEDMGKTKKFHKNKRCITVYPPIGLYDETKIPPYAIPVKIYGGQGDYSVEVLKRAVQFCIEANNEYRLKGQDMMPLKMIESRRAKIWRRLSNFFSRVWESICYTGLSW